MINHAAYLKCNSYKWKARRRKQRFGKEGSETVWSWRRVDAGTNYAIWLFEVILLHIIIWHNLAAFRALKQ